MTLTPDEAKLVERLLGGVQTKYGTAHDGRRVVVTVWQDTAEISAVMTEAASALIRIAEERERDTAVSLLSLIAEIREASGLGAKPMLSDLPAAIKTLLSKYAYERDEARQQRTAAESLAAQALRERDEAREALGPFAREAASWSAELWADTFVPVITPSVTEPGDNEKAAFTVGDLRRARALSEQPDKERT